MSRRGSEGRSESLTYKLVVYAILVLGAAPILLPFYWMVLASLKTKERVEAYPPDWLPVVTQDYVSIDGDEYRVTIRNDGRESGTQVAEVNFLHEDEDLLTLPVGDLQQSVDRFYFANIDNRRQRVRLVEKLDDGRVRVAFLGELRTVEIPADQIEYEQERRVYWTVLGADLTVEVAQDPIPKAGFATVVAILPPSPSYEGVTRDPRLIKVNIDIVDTTPEGPVVTVDDRRLPAEHIRTNREAGYYTIRLVVPDHGLRVPVDKRLRVAEAEAAYVTLDGMRRRVKPLHRDPATNLTTVELPGQHVERVIAADQLETIVKTRYFANILGQRVTVEPAETPLPPSPNAQVAVKVSGTLSVTANKLRHESDLRPQWINFALAWKEQKFDLYLANTLLIAALVVLGTTLSCGLVGYAFARLRFRGGNILFLILLSTMMIPGQVTSIPTFVMYATFGWIDTYLPLIVPHFLAHAAFFVFLYRQFMMTIPVDLEDSARIDGCGPLATWWLIMMPLSKPIIVTVAVFSFIAAWNDFLAPLLYINSDQKQTIALGLQNFKSAFQYHDPQLMMAASVMMLIPTVILFFLAQKAFMRGVVVSGVKG